MTLRLGLSSCWELVVLVSETCVRSFGVGGIGELWAVFGLCRVSRWRTHRCWAPVSSGDKVELIPWTDSR